MLMGAVSHIPGEVPAAESSTARSAERRHWFFTTRDPEFNLREALAGLAPGAEAEWPVLRFSDEMRPGDGVLLYQMSPRGSRTKSIQAVYAVGELVSTPASSRRLDGPYSGIGAPDERVVRLRYTRLLDPPMDNERIRSVPALQGHELDRSRGRVNYRLSPKEWQAFMALIYEQDPGRPLPWFWWVNQGGSYAPPIGASYLWSPQRGSRGQRVPSWDALTDMAPGDVVLHYAGGAVVAASRVVLQATPVLDPGLDEAVEAEIGWRVDVEGHELSEPIELHSIPERWRTRPMPNSPFNRHGEVNQGYAFPLHDEFTRPFVARFGHLLPPELLAERRVWAIAVGEDARFWDEFHDTGMIAIGLGEMGDLQQFESKATLQQAMVAARGGNPVHDVLAGWQFAHEMRPGDQVIAKSGRSMLYGYGVVTSDYRFDASRVEYRHVRSVVWQRTGQWAAPDGHGIAIKTLTDLTPFPDQVRRLFEIMGTEEPAANPFDRLLKSLAAEGLYFPPELVSNYLLALQTKRFVILTGISGTGKTRLAVEVARHFQPTVEVRRVESMPADAFVRQAVPSMRTSMVLPVGFTSMLRLPPIDPERNGGTVRVEFPGGNTELTFWKDPGRNVTVLSFRGDFRKWLHAAVHPGDRLLLSPIRSDDDEPDGIRIELPQLTPQVERLDNHRLIAVRPDWTDNRGLLGYHNPITEQYVTTEFLRLLLDALQEEERAEREGREPHPFFLILDEMNLARVEHYFSDFLSALESGQPIELHQSAQIEEAETGDGAAVPRRLRVPGNVFFTGTVNVDETTYMFSPKVLDRAFTLEFNEVDLTGFGNEAADAESSEEELRLTRLPAAIVQPDPLTRTDWTMFGELLDGDLQQVVVELNELLTAETRHFGYRVANEIARFVRLAAEQSDGSEDSLWAALDLALLQKVLPKFHGTQQELEGTLERLLAFAVAGTRDFDVSLAAREWRVEQGHLVPGAEGEDEVVWLPRTGAKVWRMLQRLRRQGFASYVE
jgi:5-methylcytosine-specific restriction enzyme B